MSKYSGLGRYLREQGREKIPLSFAEIERILGIGLPASAYRHRSWWSNNAENNVATGEWLNAGYQTEQVDIQNKRVVFRRKAPLGIAEPVATYARTGNAMVDNEKLKKEPAAQGQDPLFGAFKGAVRIPHHPLFGAFKGTMRIPPGVDLTEPADPEWARIVEEGE